MVPEARGACLRHYEGGGVRWEAAFGAAARRDVSERSAGASGSQECCCIVLVIMALAEDAPKVRPHVRQGRMQAKNVR